MLVGREGELTQLRSRLERGETVALLGEAGVGKTALLRETVAGSGRRLYEGGGLATVSWLPYLPVERALGRKLPSGDAAWVAGEVEAAIGNGVLLLDDLHWADEETRALLPLLHGRIALLTALRRGDPGMDAALSMLRSLGIEPIELEPLDDESSAALVNRVRPELSRSTTVRLIRRAGGNPLLLEELVVTGEPSESLQLALAARLRQLSPAGRDAFGLLALAGRPLARDLLEKDENELVDAGLVVSDDGQLAVRHALLAETAVAELEETARRRLHAHLGRLVDDPGEAARHHLAAGERELAFECATAAAAGASSPGERVAHLEVAALCADGSSSEDLRLEVADALGEMGLNDRALAVLGKVESSGSLVGARRHLFEARRSLERNDVERARLEFEAGLRVVAGTASAVEATLAVEAAQLAQTRALLHDLDQAVAAAAAARALELSRGFSRAEALARRLVGTSKLFARTKGWDDEYRSALELAGAEGAELQCRIALSFSFGLLISGRVEEADALCVEMAQLAAESHLTFLGWQLREQLVGLRWHEGALISAHDLAERLRADAGERVDVDFYLSHVLADLGQHDEARLRAERMVERALPTWQSLGDALWALTDAELAAGRPRQSLAAADRALADFGDQGPTAFLQVSRGWAQHDLGIAPDRETHVAGQAITEGAAPELEGICLLAQGSHREAAERFTAAARLWDGRHFRGMLRSTWAAGEALRRAGETAAAIESLVQAEQVALAHGYATLLARIRRSLRLAGQRRRSALGKDGVLTARERDVLELVGAGLSNVEIARRLGVGRPTVVGLIQSASRKLGARRRAQAAVLAARE